MEENYKKIWISLCAIIDLNSNEKIKTVHFGRIFLTTRSKGAKRQLKSFSKIDWNSTNKFQILQQKDEEL